MATSATKRDNAGKSTGFEHPASSSATPPFKNTKRHGQPVDDKAPTSEFENMVPKTPPTLEMIFRGEQLKEKATGGFEFCHTDFVVRMSTGDHFIVRFKKRGFLPDLDRLDLSLLDLTLVPIRDIPEMVANFAARKIGFSQHEHIFIPKEAIEPVFDPSFTVCPDVRVENCYAKRAFVLSFRHNDTGDDIKELMLMEARICEILRRNPHPNIVRYWGCQVADGRIRSLVFSKYAITLEERVKTGVPLDKRIVLQGIKDGIEHMHGLGLTHNNINPSTIMMDPADRPVIMGFHSCAAEGELPPMPGSRIWGLYNREVGSREHDFLGLSKIEEWLSKSSKK
ncbi:hypothetical protein IL306_010119 [Fusarium sp. DS 682]|nr:hypothetical protein IL306_010119 [Fusarium sp. DS 682]